MEGRRNLNLRVFKQIDVEGNITFNFEEINRGVTVEHGGVPSLERLASLINGLIDFAFLAFNERDVKISFLRPPRYNIVLRGYDKPILLKNLSEEEIDEFWKYFSKSYLINTV